jgi:hypothetical protein
MATALGATAGRRAGLALRVAGCGVFGQFRVGSSIPFQVPGVRGSPKAGSGLFGLLTFFRGLLGFAFLVLRRLAY